MRFRMNCFSHLRSLSGFEKTRARRRQRWAANQHAALLFWRCFTCRNRHRIATPSRALLTGRKRRSPLGSTERGAGNWVMASNCSLVGSPTVHLQAGWIVDHVFFFGENATMDGLLCGLPVKVDMMDFAGGK